MEKTESKKIIKLALGYAGDWGHTYIGTEHLFYALIKDFEEYAQKVQPYFSPEEYAQEIIRDIGKESPLTLYESDLTTIAKRYIRNSNTIDDLFMTLIKETNNSASLFLSQIIDIDVFLSGANPINSKAIKYYKAIEQDVPTLAKYSRNLSRLYLENKLAPIFNRDKEIREIKQIMLRRSKRNVLLTGSAGCGKSALIEAFASSCVDDRVNNKETVFSNFIVFDLSMNSLLSGSKYRGDFEERVEKILSEIQSNDNIIIFIDEMHQINEIGAAEGATSFGQILKPALARDTMRCIGATTTEESEFIKKDKALARRFSEIKLAQLTGTNAINCAEKILTDYSEFHNINTDEINVNHVMSLIADFLSNTIFPNNFIDVIDETLATARFEEKTAITMTDIRFTMSRMTGMLII